jgi:hypothetical protein
MLAIRAPRRRNPQPQAAVVIQAGRRRRPRAQRRNPNNNPRRGGRVRFRLAPNAQRRGQQMAIQQLQRNLGQSPAKRNSAFSARGVNDDIRLVKREKFGDVSGGLNSFKLTPGSSGLLVLDKISELFDTWKLNGATIEFKSTVGSTTNGQVTMGIDYNTTTPVNSTEQVGHLTSALEDNVYKDLRIPIQVAKAQKQRLMSTANSTVGEFAKSAFSAWVAAPEGTDIALFGSVWLVYDITLCSINVAASLISSAPTSTASLLADFTSADTNAVTQPVEFPAGQDQAAPDVSINEPYATDPVDESLLKTEFTVKHQAFADTGDEIIAAQAAPAPLVSAMLAATPPSVTFRYANGNPIPPGTIETQPVGGSIASFAGPGLLAPPAVTAGPGDLLSSVFKLAKPLLEDSDLIGTIANVAFGLLASSTTLNAVAPNPIPLGITPEQVDTGEHYIYATDDDVSQLVTSVAIGNEIDVVIPPLSEYPITESLPQYCSLQYHLGDPTYTYRTIGPYNATFVDGTGTNYPSYISVSAGDEPDTFRPGDVFAVTASTVKVPDVGSSFVASALYKTATIGSLPVEVNGANFLHDIGTYTTPDTIFGANLVVADGSEHFSFALPENTFSLTQTGSIEYSFVRLSRTHSVEIATPASVEGARRIHIRRS